MPSGDQARRPRSPRAGRTPSRGSPPASGQQPELAPFALAFPVGDECQPGAVGRPARRGVPVLAARQTARAGGGAVDAERPRARLRYALASRSMVVTTTTAMSCPSGETLGIGDVGEAGDVVGLHTGHAGDATPGRTRGRWPSGSAPFTLRVMPAEFRQRVIDVISRPAAGRGGELRRRGRPGRLSGRGPRGRRRALGPRRSGAAVVAGGHGQRAVSLPGKEARAGPPAPGRRSRGRARAGSPGSLRISQRRKGDDVGFTMAGVVRHWAGRDTRPADADLRWTRRRRGPSTTNDPTGSPRRCWPRGSVARTGSPSSTRTASTTSRSPSAAAKINAVLVAVNWRLAPPEMA